VFTSLDCTAGYWPVPLRKDDQEKTALTTHCGIHSRSKKKLALCLHQNCVPHVPGFLHARLKLSDVSQQESQSHFCAL